LLARPETVTITFPVVAPVGTVTTTLVALQLTVDAEVPLNITLLVPWVEPKPAPETVSCVPGSPLVVERPEMLGATVKLTPSLDTEPTVTMTFPVPASAGTVTTMLMALQLVGVAVVPLNVTVLEPCVEPKLDPLTVIDVPPGPDAGERAVIAGEVDVK
jgi:hypothetical protein